MSQSGLAHWLLQPVETVAEDAAETTVADEPVIDLVARLRTAKTGTAVVVDDAGVAIGLLDARDILDKVVYDVPPDRAVGSLLSGRPPAIGRGEPLYRAIGRLQQERLSALVVVDDQGRPCGLLRRETALAAGFGGLLSQLERTVTGVEVAELALSKAAQPDIAATLLAMGQKATDVLRLINSMNIDTFARLAAGTLDRLRADGWGEPPVPFAMIVMGSAGRGESLLHPDQDNGFILADYPDSEHGRIDGYFIELAERLTRDLAATGFPLCAGNVMATNPLWRKTLSQWRDQVSGWARRRSNLAILYADIFFDFRVAYGDPELAAALRRHVTEIARDNPPFLNQLVWQQSERASAVGLFGRLITSHDAAHSGTIDLKLNGLMPLVELVRLLALKAGIAETGTLARLAAVGNAGLIDDEARSELAESFEFLTELTLRQQLADWRAGRTPGNHLAPAALPRWRRERLIETLRSVDAFRKRVIEDLLGSVALGAAG